MKLNPGSALLQTPNQPPSSAEHLPLVPPARTSANGRDLDSLAEALPANAVFKGSLVEVLQDNPAANWGPLAADAVEAIQALDTLDDIQHVDEAVCSVAAQMLFELGQARLLCRLLECRPVHVELDVWNDTDRVDTLSRIGASWPPEASVDLRLSTQMSAMAYVSLHEFLDRPNELSIRLKDGTTRNEFASGAVAQALKCRPLNMLALDTQGFTHAGMEDLVGVQAAAVVLSAFVPSSDPQEQRKEYAALIDLLRHSGASTLAVDGAAIPDDVAAHLLVCRSKWAHVTVGSVKTLQEWHAMSLGKGGKVGRAGQVDIRFPGAGLGALDELLSAVRAVGANSLRIFGGVHLVTAMEAMEVYAHRHGSDGLLDRFSAHFTVSDNTLMEWLVGQHRYLRRCLALVHEPEQGVFPFPGSRSIDADTAARLHAINPMDPSIFRNDDGPITLARSMRNPPMGERMEPGVASASASLTSSSPGPWPSAVQRTRQVPDATQWVEPNTEAGVAQLRAFLQEGHNGPARTMAARAVLNVLDHGVGGVELRDTTIRYEVARLLLEAKQPKLLLHIAPTESSWRFEARFQREAAEIASLAPWPDNTACTVVVMSSLRGAGIARMAPFARQVSPAQWTLFFEMDAPTDSSVWASLENLVHACKGLSVGLSVHPEYAPNDSDWTGLIGFLTRIQGIPVRELQLNAMTGVPEEVGKALVATVQDCDIQHLSIRDVADTLARRVMTCRAWKRLWIGPTKAMADAVRAGGVRAETLRLNLWLGDWDGLKALFAHCEGVTAVELNERPVNVLALAELLNQNRSITTVTCGLWANGPDEFEQALALAQRNRSLTSIVNDEDVIHFANQAPQLDAISWMRLAQATNLHRFQHPEQLGPGAARGFAVSLGQRDGAGNVYRDMFQHLSRFLDLSDSVALASTTKSAYADFRRAMEKEIDQLAALLRPGVSLDAFQKGLQGAAGGLVLTPGLAPMHPDRLLREKLAELDRAGVPNGLLIQIIGRRMESLFAQADSEQRTLNRDEGRHLWELLEGLSAHGAIDPRVWREKGLGINVNVPVPGQPGGAPLADG